jgi:hypothetical protein
MSSKLGYGMFVNREGMFRLGIVPSLSLGRLRVHLFLYHINNRRAKVPLLKRTGSNNENMWGIRVVTRHDGDLLAAKLSGGATINGEMKISKDNMINASIHITSCLTASWRQLLGFSV